MFRPCRSERYRLQTIDRAIQPVEDHIARMEALSATLAAVGRDEDAAYARALLRLGRSRGESPGRGELTRLRGTDPDPTCPRHVGFGKDQPFGPAAR
jgi:hypothetical protein